MDKVFYKSKTFWFNALTIITVIATQVGYFQDADLTKSIGEALILFSPLVNLVLRFFTEKKLLLK